MFIELVQAPIEGPVKELRWSFFVKIARGFFNILLL